MPTTLERPASEGRRNFTLSTNPDQRREEIRQLKAALARVLSWYEIDLPANLFTGRANGRIQFDVVFIRTELGQTYLSLTSKHGSVVSGYGQTDAWVGLFDGHDPVFEKNSLNAVFDNFTDSFPPFVDRRYHINQRFRARKASSNFTYVSTVDYAPKTVREEEGEVAISTGDSWDLGLAGGPDGPEVSFGYSKENNTTKTLKIFNFEEEQDLIGSRPYWNFNGSRKKWGGEHNPSLPMVSNSVYSVDRYEDDAGNAIPNWDMTLFFGVKTYRKSDHHGFACGSAPLICNFKDMTITPIANGPAFTITKKEGLPPSYGAFKGAYDKIERMLNGQDPEE